MFYKYMYCSRVTELHFWAKLHFWVELCEHVLGGRVRIEEVWFHKSKSSIVSLCISDFHLID